MKRDSNDMSPTNPHGGRSSQDPQNEMHGRDESPRDGSPAGSSNDFSMRDLEGRNCGNSDLNHWSRDDFEAALPLYVGGELESVEVKRVDAWLAAHPEAQNTLAASEAAAGVLARFAQSTHQRETPDLWAGIRSGLVEEGLVGDAGPSEKLAPILGGPRWFQRKGVAAAAALLLAGSMGVFMMARGTGGSSAASTAGSTAGSVTSDGSVAVGAAGAEAREAGVRDRALPATQGMHLASNGSPLVAAVMGTDDRPVGTMAVGSQHNAVPVLIGPASPGSAGRGQRLRRPGPGAERLIDDALNVRIWQFDPSMETGLIQRRIGEDAQLTSGR